jgi:ABC-type nitrate/sulfonate/bicarbonate transport system substrate-binding protein
MTSRRAVIVALTMSCAAAILLTASLASAGDAVTVQLKWRHQSQFAGLYVADAKGFYRSEGLDVHHREWKLGERSPVEQVVSGVADFGITSQSRFLIEREKGARIVAVAAIYQRSPVVFLALTRSNIKHPRDFHGKTIAFAPTHEVPLQALLKRVGMDAKHLKRAPYGFDLAPFYKGETAIWAAHAMNQAVDARLAGHDVTVIFPDDYGIHGYDDVLFVSEELLRRKPAVVERWVRAVVRGWRYAIEHVDEATAITCALSEALKRDKQAGMLLASIPLIQTGDRPLGWMTREVWQGAAERLHEHKLLARVPALDGLFTTTFVERASR